MCACMRERESVCLSVYNGYGLIVCELFHEDYRLSIHIYACVHVCMHANETGWDT